MILTNLDLSPSNKDEDQTSKALSNGETTSSPKPVETQPLLRSRRSNPPIICDILKPPTSSPIEPHPQSYRMETPVPGNYISPINFWSPHTPKE